jgi:hypothetical protein
MKWTTVRQLAEALHEMPPDAVVLAYSDCDEGLDVVGRPTLYQTPPGRGVAPYCKGDFPDSFLGELVKCEPGTGTHGAKKDYNWVPYTGQVVIS